MSDKYSKNINMGNVILKFIKIILLLIIIMIILLGMILGGSVVSVLKDAPEIDPTTMIASLTQTSTIYDANGNLIEKVQNQNYEYRTVVGIETMPEYLIKAFMAIEDERFLSHPGVDIVGIGGAIAESISGKNLRGASTITQQLVRNMYLTPDRSLVRKITEAYLSLQVESKLNKEQIMEAYLNKIYLGQGAYGVQEAAQTYFSKDVGDLTLAESAILAGIPKSTTNYQPYMRIHTKDYDENTMKLIGETDVLGQHMYLIFNPKSVERQKIVLKKMLDLGFIDENAYDGALGEDITTSLKPGEKVYHTMTSYPIDFIQKEAAEMLAKHYNISYAEAQNKVFNDGLKIYSTIDQKLQEKLEYMYENFTEVLAGNTNNIKAPFLIDWSLDKNKNIIDEKGNVLYYKADNCIDENYNVVIPNSDFTYENGEIKFKANNITMSGNNMIFSDVYTINGEKNLVTHSIGSVSIPSEQYSVDENRVITIKKDFIDANPDLFEVVGEKKNLRISHDFYNFQIDGIVQPQSATVIMDYRTGGIVAMVGGRDVYGNKILNRATESQRQPGSAIKPISVYFPALASGKTAGSIADDVPITVDGKAWPKNAYKGYKGLETYRMALNDSSNAGTVNVLEQIGIDTSLQYLEKLGILDSKNPASDSIVTKDENPTVNDENPSALALGGMTKGLNPLELTAAYGAIANDGVFNKPRIVSKILDSNGNIIIDDVNESRVVTDEKTAYIMKDMLRTVVKNGYTAKPAKIKNMVTAGKTGTTTDQTDIWFVGFTPYYVMGTWIGNDNPSIYLQKGSLVAAEFWNKIGEYIHEDLEPVEEFKKPEGIVTKYISFKSGDLATNTVSSFGHSTEEIFAKGTEPENYDDSYTTVEVCDLTGDLATKWCPSTSSKTVFMRKEPYKAEEHGGYTPADVSSVPQDYCSVHTEESFYDYYYGPYGPGFSKNKKNDDD